MDRVRACAEGDLAGAAALAGAYPYGHWTLLPEDARAVMAARLERGWQTCADGDFVLDAGRGPEALLRARMLDWDSDFFGFPCGTLSFVHARGDGPARLGAYRELLPRAARWFRARGARFVTVKCDSRDTALVQALTEAGCRMVEVQVNLWHDLARIPAPGLAPGFALRASRDEDLPALRDVSAASRWDRFHADHAFPAGLTDAFRRTWIGNLHASASDEVLVAEADGRAAGFVTTRLDPQMQAGQIKLVGVAPASRGRGLGTALVLRALESMRGRAVRMLVQTQASNCESVRLYLKAGFAWAPSGATFHWWSPGAAPGAA
jgi:GNAT superfamily N-acetyltransferase